MTIDPSARLRRHGLRAGALLAAVAFSATACSGHHNSAASAADRSSSAAAAASSSSAAAAPTRSSAIDTISVAVAKRSRDQVTQLHALAVNAGHTGGIPARQIPLSAKQVSGQLKAQIQACSTLRPAASTPAGALTSSLRTYAGLADQLAAWNATAAYPLPATYFTQLVAADTAWRSAMQQVGQTAHTDLLAGLAPLLLPKK